MGQERLTVRKIREVLRLKADGFSDRQIATAIGSARSTVQECVRRARDAGIAWPLAPALDEAALHAKMYRRSVPLSRTPRPDFAYLHAELRRRGVTRLLLWEEYKATHPDGCTSQHTKQNPQRSAGRSRLIKATHSARAV